MSRIQFDALLFHVVTCEPIDLALIKLDACNKLNSATLWALGLVIEIDRCHDGLVERKLFAELVMSRLKSRTTMINVDEHLHQYKKDVTSTRITTVKV